MVIVEVEQGPLYLAQFIYRFRRTLFIVSVRKFVEEVHCETSPGLSLSSVSENTIGERTWWCVRNEPYRQWKAGRARSFQFLCDATPSLPAPLARKVVTDLIRQRLSDLPHRLGLGRLLLYASVSTLSEKVRGNRSRREINKISNIIWRVGDTTKRELKKRNREKEREGEKKEKKSSLGGSFLLVLPDALRNIDWTSSIIDPLSSFVPSPRPSVGFSLEFEGFSPQFFIMFTQPLS